MTLIPTAIFAKIRLLLPPNMLFIVLRTFKEHYIIAALQKSISPLKSCNILSLNRLRSEKCSTNYARLSLSGTESIRQELTEPRLRRFSQQKVIKRCILSPTETKIVAALHSRAPLRLSAQQTIFLS